MTHLSRLRSFLRALPFVGLLFIPATGASAQQAEPEKPQQAARASDAPAAPPALSAAEGVPRLVKFAGTLKDAKGTPRMGVVGLTFAIHAKQEGGAPLWLETQNVTLDEQGRYSVLLGATKS